MATQAHELQYIEDPAGVARERRYDSQAVARRLGA